MTTTLEPELSRVGDQRWLKLPGKPDSGTKMPVTEIRREGDLRFRKLQRDPDSGSRPHRG